MSEILICLRLPPLQCINIKNYNCRISNNISTTYMHSCDRCWCARKTTLLIFCISEVICRLHLAPLQCTSNNDCTISLIIRKFLLTGAGMHSHLKNLRFIQVELATRSISQHDNNRYSQRIQSHYRRHNHKRSYY